ncbi:DUF2550 family protein [Demetria terragena]|uniref:DUF2550 family protein n=1 Tax=Demetria terragena TaxID=63959 RepID=UPI00036F0CB4|nr:DUF2550 family protein [Demetria terragena]
MGELVVTGEILGGLLLCVALALGILVMRRRHIARSGPMVLMSVNRDGSWHAGMASVGVTTISWFPLFGVRLRPTHEWQRGQLVLGAPTEPPHRPTGMGDPVLVAFEQGAQSTDIVVGRSAYTAVRSWSESAPPGLNANPIA